jgi:predicted nucleic acid-binding protein
MTHGIDTDFLVAVEVADHPFHASADTLLTRLLNDGHELALAPQTLAEFIHVVSDARRMPKPLAMTEAISRAEHWWQAAEIVRVFPDPRSVADFLQWLRIHRLGRKRLLDTMLAAAFRNAGIRRIITNNHDDYRLFGCFELIGYAASDAR